MGTSIDQSAADRTAAVKKAGYDGVIMRGNSGEMKEIVVFEPNQIKSATGNKGTFNPDSNKITESLTEAKDGDGDGKINDGKPSEAPAEKKDKKRSTANPKLLEWAKKKFGDDEKAENFAKWFGDSKVVDSEGNPLIVYHGTDKEFEEFKPSEKGMLGKGIYSSAKKEDYGTYSAYAKKENAAVMPLYVKLENPHIAIAGKPDTFDAKPENDGTIMIDSRTKAIVWAVAKNPSQVKSAIGNKGTFNPDSNKITESLTGRQKAMLERWKDYP